MSRFGFGGLQSHMETKKIKETQVGKIFSFFFLNLFFLIQCNFLSLVVVVSGRGQAASAIRCIEEEKQVFERSSSVHYLLFIFYPPFLQSDSTRFVGFQSLCGYKFF